MVLKKVNRRKLIVSDGQILCSPSADEIAAIKNKLTFDNPAYRNAIRFSRYSRVAVPPSLMYYEQGRYDEESCIKVPIGFDVSSVVSDKLEVIDNRVYSKVDHAPFVLTLREDQEKAAENYLSFKDSLPPRNIIQLPTGKGKSILGLYIASQLSCKTLIVVHKDDLVEGWRKDIVLAFDNKVHAGLIKAKSREVGHFITIATVQTLNRLSAEELNKLYDTFGFVIQDEMHHCVLGDSLILKQDGGVVPITSIKKNDSVYGGTVNTPFNILSKVYRMSYKHGMIEGSADHLSFCLDKRKYFNKHTRQCDFTNAEFEVKHLSEIDDNYVIPVLRKAPHTVRNSVSPEEASFVAMIMCDGHLDKDGNRVKVNVSKDKAFYRTVFEKFVPDCKSSYDCRGNLTVWSTDKHLKSFLETVWGIPRGKKSNTIRVPDFLYYSPLKTIKAFIETCFSCEGDLNYSNGNYRMCLNTCSKSFAQGLSLLLKKFGIVTNFQVISRSGKHNTVYRISCSGAMFNEFMNTFTLIPRKTTLKRNSGEMNHNRVFGDYIMSDVKKVESLGYSDVVYDFEVPESHSFIANGTLTHNCPASSYSVVSNFRPRYRLGLTATPERSDGLDHIMNLYYGSIVFKYEDDKETDEENDILPVKVIKRKSLVYFDPLFQNVGTDEHPVYKLIDLYAPAEVEMKHGYVRISEIPYKDRPTLSYQVVDNFVVNDEVYKAQVCGDVAIEYDRGHSCILFFTQKEQCRTYFEALKEFIPEESIGLYYGDNSDNKSVLEKAEKQRPYVTLTTYAKATEGTNVKQWEVEFLVSSINNEKNTEQAVGRIRRVKEGSKLSTAVLYDYRVPYVYSLANHGATRDRRYKKLGFIIEGENPQQKRSIFKRGY